MSNLGPLPKMQRIDPVAFGHRSFAALGYSADQMRAYAAEQVAAERDRWRGIAHRVAADANRYGCEGLRMRCTISEGGGLVSWEVDRA